MKSLSKLLVAVVMLSGTAFAQSAKVNMQMGDPKVLPRVAALTDSGNWSDVMSGRIHTSSQKDLVFGVSLVTSLLTDTTVSSSAYRKSESPAEASIEVRVLGDGQEATPGTVTFDRRRQYLMAQFDGFSCGSRRWHDRPRRLRLPGRDPSARARHRGRSRVLLRQGGRRRRRPRHPGAGPHEDLDAGHRVRHGRHRQGAFTVEEVRLVNGTDEQIPSL
jgi:hypothetical protein